LIPWIRGGTTGGLAGHLGITLDAILILAFAALAVRYAILELYLRAKDAGSAVVKLAMAGGLLVVTAGMATGIFAATMGMWLPLMGIR
jgi:hypothetical protein